MSEQCKIASETSSGRNLDAVFFDDRMIEPDRLSGQPEQMGTLLGDEFRVSLRSCFRLLQFLRGLVPDCPKAILRKEAAMCGSALHHLIASADRFEVPTLRSATQTVAYRWQPRSRSTGCADVVTTIA